MPRFRETLWFKKGNEAPAKDAPDDGDAERPIEDAYDDDGTITMIDHAAYSVKTGQTQACPHFPDMPIPSGNAQPVSPDADPTISLVVGQMHKGRATVFAMLGASVVAVAVVVAMFVS